MEKTIYGTDGFMSGVKWLNEMKKMILLTRTQHVDG